MSTDISKDRNQFPRWPMDSKCSDFMDNATTSSQKIALSGKIFFLETSENINPNLQFMCAVESAARTHPNMKVTVMMRGLQKQNVTMSQNFGIRLLRCFPNVEFLPLDFAELFTNTPLSTWFSAVEKHRAFTDLPILSDACRLAILWKFGGIYLDTDFIVLKNLKHITNALGTSRYSLNGAFLSFNRSHKFIELCMQDFTSNYNFWIYGHQGPQLLTRVFKRWCSISRLTDSMGCRGVTILPREAFYPVEWQDWRRYYELINPYKLMKFLENTYAVHLWNKKSRGERPKAGTFLEQIQSRFCPTSYSLMKMYL
ncbi:LOW QUALITY PROTEIN: lactosylceramide 4-alpha-galactosyltransferase [Rhinophrynus dorsalis]